MKDFEKAASLGNQGAAAFLESMKKKEEPSTGLIQQAPKPVKGDPSGMKIPDTPAGGRIHGESFVSASSKIENGILTIRDGKDFFPDHAVMIFLFLKEGETAEGKTYHVTPESGFGSPHIHMKWRPQGKDIPETETFVQKYTMRLEFGKKEGNQLPGRIFLQLPDQLKSTVKGTFQAEIK
jgi:hypothetical protein